MVTLFSSRLAAQRSVYSSSRFTPALQATNHQSMTSTILRKREEESNGRWRENKQQRVVKGTVGNTLIPSGNS
jgi:hypothetical protein